MRIAFAVLALAASLTATRTRSGSWNAAAAARSRTRVPIRSLRSALELIQQRLALSHKTKAKHVAPVRADGCFGSEDVIRLGAIGGPAPK